jgi:thiol:disulfide interchange protein DsbA
MLAARPFNLIAVSILAIIVCACSAKESEAEPAQAEPPKAQEIEAEAPMEWVEGTHYLLMEKPVATVVDAPKVEVTEIFRFGCPACYHFELLLQKWQPNEHVSLVQVPVVWDNVTAAHAGVYFTGLDMGLGSETKMALFKAIHEVEDKKAGQMAATSMDGIVALFESIGVDRAQVEAALQNQAIGDQINASGKRAYEMAIEGTPEIIVDGRYRVTTDSAGGFENMLKVADYLVAKIVADSAQEAASEAPQIEAPE